MIITIGKIICMGRYHTYVIIFGALQFIVLLQIKSLLRPTHIRSMKYVKFGNGHKTVLISASLPLKRISSPYQPNRNSEGPDPISL